MDTCFAKPRPRTPTESRVAAKGARFTSVQGVHFICSGISHRFREIPSGSGVATASEMQKFTVHFRCIGSVGEPGFLETFFFFAILNTWQSGRTN